MSQRLFIRIKDGNPFEHPIVESNMIAAFPNIDLDNLPSNFAEFIRVPRPEPDEGKYIVSATVSYQWDGNVVKDVWQLVQEDLIIEAGNTEESGNIEAGNLEE